MDKDLEAKGFSSTFALLFFSLKQSHIFSVRFSDVRAGAARAWIFWRDFAARTRQSATGNEARKGPDC